MMRAIQDVANELGIAAGTGCLLALDGYIVTMPGLPRQPAACSIDIFDEGEITCI
jgi:formate--tetrahydrofolate ligase